MKEDILELYNEVFDKNGSVKLCGREKCIDLIRALSNKYPEENFGDTESGFMNVNVIKKYMGM